MEDRPLLEGVDAERVLGEALSRGGEFAEIFAEDKATTLIEIEGEKVEKLIQGSRSGAGVRALHSFRTAYSYTDLISTPSLFECAQVSASAVSEGKDRIVPARGAAWACHRLPVLEPPERVPVADKLELLWKAERAARKLDPRVRQVRLILLDQARSIAVADSQGLRAADALTYTLFFVMVVAGDESGLQVAREMAGGTSGFELFKEHDPEELALRAARRALTNLTAAYAPARAMPVVLAAEAGGTMIHEAIGHGLEADLAHEGMSVFADKIGERVASPLITVIDDATLPGRRGSFSIDDEGSPAQATVLVEKGVLKSYLYDRRLAMKHGRVSTGNGRRESYAFPPLVRMTNTLIAPGASDPAEVLRSVDRGLLVKRMGGGEVNTVNGDFVFEVEEGYLIENGKQGDPVRGATLTGNGPRLLKEIDMVGSDLGFGLGTCGKDGQGSPVSDAQPTLRLPEVVVGGRFEN